MNGTPANRVELKPARSPRVLRHLAIGILFGVGLFVVGGGIYNLSYDTLGGAWVLGLGLLVLFGAEALRRANVNRADAGCDRDLRGEAEHRVPCAVAGAD